MIHKELTKNDAAGILRSFVALNVGIYTWYSALAEETVKDESGNDVKKEKLAGNPYVFHAPLHDENLYLYGVYEEARVQQPLIPQISPHLRPPEEQEELAATVYPDGTILESDGDIWLTDGTVINSVGAWTDADTGDTTYLDGTLLLSDGTIVLTDGTIISPFRDNDVAEGTADKLLA